MVIISSGELPYKWLYHARYENHLQAYVESINKYK